MKALAIAFAAFAANASAQLPQVPRNLDFAETASNGAPPGWQFNGPGYSVAQRADCECAAISPTTETAHGEASLFQTLDAVLLRGKSVVFDAELRVNSGAPAANARIWIRVNHTGKPPSVFDNLSGEPVRASEWSRSDLHFSIDADAASLDFGVAVTGGAAFVRSVALEVDGHIVGSPFERMGPANLTFSRGEIGGLPAFWSVTPTSFTTSPVSFERDRCFKGPVCASVRAPYSLSQSFGAIPYRGKVVRLRARIRSEGKAPNDRARLWLRVEAPSPRPSFLMTQRTEYRDSANSEWVEVTLAHKIEDEALNLAVGITAYGATVASIDAIAIDVVADSNVLASAVPKAPVAPALPVPRVATAEPPVRSNPPSAPPPGEAPAAERSVAAEPSVEEQQHLIARAAAKAADYTAQLPNFMCVQMIQRSENHRNQGWRARDMLTVQLGYADGQEHYKLLTVNNRPTNAPYLSVSGAISEGEFGSTLREIFRPQTAKFLWEREETWRGHRVSVFSYRMLQDK